MPHIEVLHPVRLPQDASTHDECASSFSCAVHVFLEVLRKQPELSVQGKVLEFDLLVRATIKTSQEKKWVKTGQCQLSRMKLSSPVDLTNATKQIHTGRSLGVAVLGARGVFSDEDRKMYETLAKSRSLFSLSLVSPNP
jgi:hypothetical protein